ncbi:MAG: hypothetical protein JNK00_01600 [Flavipsychrobacter sp.]|nr:hypothetical protein [Flavipsychrobacter sp.]
MHTGNHYTLSEFVYWTRREIYKLLAISATPTILYAIFGCEWLAIPWVPIALIGTAAAFLVGFKNTQTYNRLWEARQIYGAIVNSSRAWGIMARDFVADKEAQRILIYRHIAWLTALRYQLREPRAWENMTKNYNREYKKYIVVPEELTTLEEELKKYLSLEDEEYILTKKNRAAQLIAMQSAHLKTLQQQGQLGSLNYIEMENMLVNLYEQQGKCERIKNFPYPRQFASINLFFIKIFVFVVPFGLLNEFHKMGEYFIWLNVPFSLVVTWIFTTMEKVGEATENPFEGNANDVPISALSRTIEIDLRDMLDEKDLPQPITPTNLILM